MGKSPGEAEAAPGRPADHASRCYREQPELDQNGWGPGVDSRLIWDFPWGCVTVQFDERDRSVTAEVCPVGSVWGDLARIFVDSRPPPAR